MTDSVLAKKFMPFTIYVLSIFPFILEGEEKVVPKAVFTAVFWEEFQNESFLYAPWGNESEENASIVEISVGSSVLSRKFAYYGNGELKLYSNSLDENGNLELENLKIRAKNPTVRFQLPLSESGITKEYLLLFTDKKSNGTWRIFPMPFSTSEIPFGSYKFISQLRSNLFFIFGQEKITLAPGKTAVVQGKPDEGQRGIMLKIMGQKNGRVTDLFSQKWGHSPKMRGIYFLGMNNGEMTVKRIIELESPISASAGYGVQPITVSEQNDEEVNLDSSF